MSQEKDTAEEARQEAKATQVMLLESELLIEDLKNNVTRLSSVEVSLKDEKTNLEKQLGGLRVKIEKFKTQAENSKTEKSQIEDSLSSRIESQVKDIAERDIQISQLSDKYRQSEKIAQDRAEVITLLNERLETIETEKLGSIRDRDNTAKDSADKTREISTLRAKIDEIVSDREALKVRLESDISALRHQQASAQTDHEQTADGHRSTIATLEMAMVDMGRRLTQAIADEQMAKVRIDDKNAQIDAKNSEIDIMQLNIDKLKADIDGLNAGIDNVKREAETSEKRIIDESRERIEKLEVDHTREIQRLETNKKDAFESWKEQKNHLDMQIRDLGISKDTEHAEKLAALDEDHRQIIDKCKKEAREEIEVKIEEEAKKWENEFREMVKSKDAKFQDALSLHKQEMQERVDIIRAEVNQQHSETLESELAALKHKLIMEHNSLLNATKKALEDAIETQKHELEYQLSELTRDKDAIIHKYETECQNLQAKYDQIKSEYQLSNKQWTIRESELVHSIDSLKVEHDSIKEQENSKEQIILDLKNKLEEIQSELNESQTSNNQSLSEVNSISEQLRKVREDLRNTQDSKIETEESLIKEKESTAQLESEKCVLHNTVAELTNDLERLKTESSQFESKLNQTIEVMAQIKNDLNVANESLLSLEIQAQDEKQQSARALDDLNKRLNTKDERISALTHEMNEMTSQISAKDERLASLSQEISDLSSKNKSSENLIEKLKKNITAKDEEINGLKVVDQDSKAEISRLTSELSNLASSTAAKDKGIERLEAELQRTKESIKAARDTESSEMQNVIDSLREQLEKSIAEANFANDKSTSLSAEVESIKLEKKKIGKEFSALVLKLTASTAEFEQKVAENEQLKEKIDNIETNSKINEKDLSEKIKNMTAEYSSKMAVAAKKHQDELITHKKDHEALVSQLESASASTQSLTKELQAAQKFLQAEKVKLKDIQSELDEVKATSKQRESHNQAALTSKQQSIATLEASVSRLSNDNAALRDKLKAADSEVVRETGRRRTSEDELRAELAMLTAGHSSELKAVKVKMDEESKTMCESVKAELEAEKSKLEMSVLKLQKEFEATKIKLKERDSELAFVKTDLQSNSATKDKEVTTLRHQIEETTRGIADLKVELSKSKSLIVQLEADLKSRTESVGMMEEQIKEKSKQIDDLRQTLSIEASKSKEASEKNRNKLENDLLEANLKADKATMMNNTLRKQVEDSQTELEKVMNELGNFKKSATAGNSVQNEKDVLIQKVTADLMRVVLDL